jgi:hypothetical protein
MAQFAAKNRAEQGGMIGRHTNQHHKKFRDGWLFRELVAE